MTSNLKYQFCWHSIFFPQTLLVQFPNQGSWIQMKTNWAFLIIHEFRITQGAMYTSESSANFNKRNICGSWVAVSVIFHSVGYIRKSDLQNTKYKDGAFEKNIVGYKFEFPRQYIISKTCIILDQSAYVEDLYLEWL